jgi:glutamate synthase (NADPH/NADH) small chain
LSPSVTFEEHPEVAKRFPDLHPPFTRQQAVVESNRCLNCFDAPCTAACPTHIDVPKFIKKISTGNLRGSATSILEANVLAGSCSRVCPVQVLCEGACVMHRYNEKPIEIGLLQRHAMETFYASGAPIPRRSTSERPQHIACIGAGPASLACAAELRQQGFQITIFDKRPLPGGLNTYGVAEYKLRTADSLREIELIRNLGVEFRTADIANDTALAQLELQFDAIFLGVGLGEMHTLEIPGGDHPDVVDALEFIAAYKTGALIESPGRVAVIGAGNTAIDAAVAARRLGATEVHIIYRRDHASISAFDFEYLHARHEGVSFLWSALPIAIHAKPYGTGTPLAIECVRTTTSEQGSLIPIPGSEFELICDLVIPAIGQSPLIDFLSKLRGIETAKGRVVTDRATGQTSNPRYFAGGDCVNGGREVVDAVADGKRAGLGITAFFNTKSEAEHG